MIPTKSEIFASIDKMKKEIEQLEKRKKDALAVCIEANEKIPVLKEKIQSQWGAYRKFYRQ